MAGWACFGRLRLKVREDMWAIHAPLTLSGRIVAEPVGSRLRLHYRLPISLYLFFPIWYLSLIASLLGSLAEGAVIAHGPELAIIVVMTTFCLAAPIYLLTVSTSSADADFQELVDFLEREAQAKSIPSGMMS